MCISATDRAHAHTHRGGDRVGRQAGEAGFITYYGGTRGHVWLDIRYEPLPVFVCVRNCQLFCFPSF